MDAHEAAPLAWPEAGVGVPAVPTDSQWLVGKQHKILAHY